MKKLFYLASGIILCASFLPKEVNAKPIKITSGLDGMGELLIAKKKQIPPITKKKTKELKKLMRSEMTELLSAKEAKNMIGSGAMKKTCENKSTEFTFLRTKRSGVIGKKYGRVFRSSRDAKVFFEDICMSSNPGKMMKKGF